MMKLLLLVLSLGFLTTASAQTDTTAKSKPVTTSPVTSTSSRPLSRSKKDWSKVSLSNRSNDHFMFQLGYNAWSKVPDSLKTKGIPRTVNVYFMMDFPFKTDPRFSVGAGLGISTSGMYFDKNTIDIAGTTTNLAYRNVANTDHYKKYKLATSYLEVPLELRYAVNPEENNKSLKFAIGAKIGTLVNAHIKGKNLQEQRRSAPERLYHETDIQTVFQQYTPVGYCTRGSWGVQPVRVVPDKYLFKTAVAPEVHPYTIGLTLSGL